jgi:hypothetical protein
MTPDEEAPAMTGTWRVRHEGRDSIFYEEGKRLCVRHCYRDAW